MRYSSHTSKGGDFHWHCVRMRFHTQGRRVRHPKPLQQGRFGLTTQLAGRFAHVCPHLVLLEASILMFGKVYWCNPTVPESHRLKISLLFDMRVKTKPTKSLSVHPHAILLVISEPQMNLYLESHRFFKRQHHRKVHFGLSLISIDKLLLFTVKNLPWEYYHPILQKWVYHAFQWEKVNSFRFRNLLSSFKTSIKIGTIRRGLGKVSI